MAQYKTFSNMGKEENAPDPSTMGEVPRISSLQERKAMIGSNTMVVIDYYTDWCGPCKQCAPRFAQLAYKYSKPGMYAFVKENVEDQIGSLPVSIRGVPCFHIYYNGQLLSEHIITGADIGMLEHTIKNLMGIK
jgi:thioredoxin 1